MKFSEEDIENIDFKTNPMKIVPLIFNDFSGETYELELSESDRILMEEVMKNFTRNGLSYKQFNEVLLLLNQLTVGQDFFKFIFGRDFINIKELKEGVIKFRGYALLCFGNFRFAFKKLINLSIDEIVNNLFPYCRDSKDFEDKLKGRRKKTLEIRKIPKEKTWFTGYLSGKNVELDLKKLDEIKNGKIQTELNEKEINEIEALIEKTGKHVEKTQIDALHNTDVYLTWENMDLYIATSMRNNWEFEQSYEFIEKIENNLKEYNLRFFDPTQSTCKNPRDKGLIESLMLKRAFATIYLAQETDTIGKDSELAITLAQRKPVIAYVPDHDPIVYSTEIAKYPLHFFKLRLFTHMANETFEDPKYREISKQSYTEEIQIINKFLEELYRYRETQPIKIFKGKDEKFKKSCQNFKKVCEILALAECFTYDSRAELLKGRHPLSMQADLTTGVANGVIVTRTPEECSEIIEKLIKNQMEFKLIRDDEYIALIEKKTESQFRVITKNKRLTNSFWNYFLK